MAVTGRRSVTTPYRTHESRGRGWLLAAAAGMLLALTGSTALAQADGADVEANLLADM